MKIVSYLECQVSLVIFYEANSIICLNCLSKILDHHHLKMNLLTPKMFQTQKLKKLAVSIDIPETSIDHDYIGPFSKWKRNKIENFWVDHERTRSICNSQLLTSYVFSRNCQRNAPFSPSKIELKIQIEILYRNSHSERITSDLWH